MLGIPNKFIISLLSNVNNNSSFVFSNIFLLLLHFVKLKEDILRSSRFEQEENILSILITFVVLKLDKLSFFNKEQCWNISFIYSTFSVLKEFISSSSKLVIFLNIPDIFFIFDVSNFDKFNDLIFEHPENISFILSTFLVDNPSINVLLSKFEQPSNICDISFTFSVKNLSIFILFKLEQLLKSFEEFIILEIAILSN